MDVDVSTTPQLLLSACPLRHFRGHANCCLLVSLSALTAVTDNAVMQLRVAGNAVVVTGNAVALAIRALSLRARPWAQEVFRAQRGTG
jgi:hypothetical protein